MPFGPWATYVAPSASVVAGRSEAGSAWAIEPPIVPRWRTCGSPTWLAAWASSGTCSCEQIGVLDVHVAGERADRDVVAGVADVRQVAQPADVDEHRRLGQAQLHQRQQAVAAGEELGLVAVLADEADRLVGRPART